MSMPSVLVLNGPNLNLLGTRQPHIYGAETLADVERRCRAAGEALGLAIDFRQSNAEHQLIDWLLVAAFLATSAAAIIPGVASLFPGS